MPIKTLTYTSNFIIFETGYKYKGIVDFTPVNGSVLGMCNMQVITFLKGFNFEIS